MDENKIWEIRAFVYQHIVESTRPPLVEETAAHFGLSQPESVAAYEELHARHALYLKPGAHEILMANPFSGVETEFRVHSKDKTYFANCARDSLGIPATLQADGQIEAACAQSREPIRLSMVDGQISRSDALVHFLIPFRQWYADLIST